MQTGQILSSSESWTCQQWGTRAPSSEEKQKCKWTGTILKVSGSSFHLAPNCAVYLKLQNSLLLGKEGKRPLHSGVTGDKSAPQNKCPNTGTINVNLTLVWTPSAKILKMQFQAQKEASQIQEPAKHKGSEILALRGQEEKNWQDEKHVSCHRWSLHKCPRFNDKPAQTREHICTFKNEHNSWVWSSCYLKIVFFSCAECH